MIKKVFSHSENSKIEKCTHLIESKIKTYHNKTNFDWIYNDTFP